MYNMSKGILYTTYFAKLNQLDIKPDAKVLIISRYVKSEMMEAFIRDFGAVHTPVLAPSGELLKSYKDEDIDWSDYVWQYLREICLNATAHKYIERIKSLLDNGIDVYLICYENLSKENSHCHRTILANIISSFGYFSKEA